MLQFFRKYQKIFFIFVTLIIVCTFVFFGTYQAIAPGLQNKEHDELAFKTITGRKIRKSYLDTAIRFLGSEGWMATKSPFSANFLNDGVISKDFLDSGLALSIYPYLTENFKMEIEEKFAKEKTYNPYAHPYAPHLSALNIWSLFAPEIPEKLAVWKDLENAADKKAFEERIALFLAQRKFPPAFLSQVIRYQQREHLSTGSDPRLLKDDLSLFGYHNLSDWFGSEFMTEVCRCIIQTAELARKKGIEVAKGEVLGELLGASQKMYDSFREKTEIPVHDAQGLMHIFFRQNGFDEATVLRIWEDVTLFRKYLNTVGSGALVDLLPFQNFFAYAHENVSIELYQMAQELRFQNIQDLKRFETYLAAVGAKRNSTVDLPTHYAPIEEIEKRAPELVGKKYRLFVAAADKESLSGKISLKDTWAWECEPANWEILKNEFPQIAQKTGDPVEILDRLDGKTRKRLDAFANKQIVSQHPEWMLDLLKEKSMDEKEIFITSVSEKPLEGIKDSLAFQKILDEKDEIVGYSQDGDHTYRILVQERYEDKKVLSFKEALEAAVLDKIGERLEIDQVVSQVVQELALRHLSSKEINSDKKEEKVLPYRFADFLSKKQEAETDLSRQWKVVKKEKTLTRSDASFLSFDEVLALEPNQVSQVKANLAEGAFYYKLLDKKMDSSLPLDKVVKTQELLAKEVKKNVFDKLVKEFLD